MTSCLRVTVAGSLTAGETFPECPQTGSWRKERTGQSGVRTRERSNDCGPLYNPGALEGAKGAKEHTWTLCMMAGPRTDGDLGAGAA